MRSNPRRLPEEARSSLDESSYEVLGESVFDTSDDEGHTESLASTDGHTPDDVSSISDGDEFDDDYMDDASQHFPHSHAEATDDPLDAHQITSPGESTFTELADKEMSESSHLRLEETHVMGSDDVDACGLIKEFDQTSGLPDVLQPYGCPEVRLTVRMALSERYMSISRSFRLLFIGALPDWAERDISRQIGTALDAPPSSSRFNIVRGQLEPSGPVLDVDHCTSLKAEGDASKSSRVMLTLDDGTQLTFGPGKVIQRQGSAPLPDLVIFYHGTSVPPVSGAITESQKFRFVRKAFTRLQIPSLDVALARPFGQCPEAFTSDASSLRLCVEGRKYQDSDYEVQETLPIDIYDFIKIEPSQLNRHLACIRSHAFHGTSRDVNGEEQGWRLGKFFPSFKKSVARLDIRDLPVGRLPWIPLLTLTVMVFGALWTSIYIPSIPYKIPSVEILSSTHPPPSSVYTTPVASIAASVRSIPSSSVDPAKSTPRDLTLVTVKKEIAKDQRIKQRKEGLQQEKLQQEKAGGFELQVTGDHQFLLRHPKHFSNSRRRPHLSVQVTRDSKDVLIRFDSASGVVDLEHDYPLGLFNVTIVARSKPLMQQSFEITLGSNKSTLTQLKENIDRLSQTIKQDLSLAQSNLRNLTTAVTKGLQAGVLRVEDGASAAFGQTKYWRKHVQESTQSVAEHLQDAKKAATQQLSIGTEITKDLSKIFRRNLESCTSRASDLAHTLQGARMPDFWKLTAPVRTSAMILKARRNALRLQTKVQTSLREKREAKAELKETKRRNNGDGFSKSKKERPRKEKSNKKGKSKKAKAQSK